MERKNRRAFSLLEVIVAVAISSVLLGTTGYFYQMGNRQIVKVSDHAQARMEAMTVLDLIGRDLDRLVVDDNLRNLVFPVDIKDEGRTLEFYGLHHREYRSATRQMRLVGRKIVWTVREANGAAGGLRIVRNGTAVRRISAVSDIRFEPMDLDRACELSISPFHALWVIISPQGAWDRRNSSLAQENVQRRLYHMSHIESQYACMLSIKNSNPPPGVYQGLDLLDDPFYGRCPLVSSNPDVPMDWVRPPGLVRLDDTLFDNSTANIDVGI